MEGGVRIWDAWYGCSNLISFLSRSACSVRTGTVGYGLCVDACGLEDYSTRYTTVDDYNGHQHRNHHGEGRKEEFNCLSLLPSLAVRRYRTWIDPAVLLCEEVSKGMSGEGGV